MKTFYRMIALLILVSMILTACQSQATETASEALPAGTPVVIRAGTGDGGDGLTPHQQIIQNFEDQNPDIIVQLEAVAGRDYYARLLTQLAAKAAPDIMQIGDDAVPSFVEKGAFFPLEEGQPSILPFTCLACWNRARWMGYSTCCLRTIHRWGFTTTRNSSTQPA